MNSQIISITIISALLLLMDFYISKVFLSNRKHLFRAYWIMTGLTFAAMLMGIFISIGRNLRVIIMVWFFISNFTKLFILPFLLIDDLRRGIVFIKKKDLIKQKKINEEILPLEKSYSEISRSEFLKKAGLVVAAVPFAALNIGMMGGVYDYEVKRLKIKITNLPKEFQGLRIAQISDIHSGSFYNKMAVQGGIDMLLNEKPDLIFFTGDLVNDRTSEVNEYFDIFSKVQAPLGVYSIYGNHDYGDYVKWNSVAAKAKNLDDLRIAHEKLGWNLLRNENKILKIQGEELAILGVENWGSLGRFPKYGDIEKAKIGTESASVKLLLSHDPSHWRAKIVEEQIDIDMMFSGHTHGMQFGIRTDYFQWSPVQYFYPEWAGLYQNKNQKLYVNVGYGFLGYPGRVGIAPEITIFELEKS